MAVAINDVTNNADHNFAVRVDGYSDDLATSHLQPTAGSPGAAVEQLRGDLASGALVPAGQGTRIEAHA